MTQEVDRDANHHITVGTSPSLKLLNRFNNITVCKLANHATHPHRALLICPFVCTDDNNRIVLRPIECYAACQRDFINACYIDVCSHHQIWICLLIYLYFTYFSSLKCWNFLCRVTSSETNSSPLKVPHLTVYT